MTFTGKWTGDGLTVELVDSGDGQLEGAIELGGTRMPLRAMVQGTQLAGAFESQGYAYNFVGRLEGDALLLESDGQAFRLAREAPPRPPNPLFAAARGTPTQPPSPAAPAPAPAPSAPAAPAAEADETRYRHATGGEIVLPRGWQVTHSPLGLQLVPPDAGYGPHGPAEVYLLNVQPVPGVTRPDDPRILGFVEGSLRQLVPTLAAEGAATPCGPGTRMLWRGTNPMTGAEVLAVALLQIAHDSVVGIIGLGERARVEQRSAALERIFASYRRGEGQRDPALVGTWHYWSYSGTSSLITGSSTSSETRRTVMLGADGSLIERSSHEGIGNFHDSSGGVRDYLGGYASQRSDGRSGSWSAGDGMLFVSWSDGQQSAWRYQLSGLPGSRHLTLHEVSGGGKPMEWSEQPVVV